MSSEWVIRVQIFLWILQNIPVSVCVRLCCYVLMHMLFSTKELVF